MSQRSITSFFTCKPQQKKAESSEGEDSPSKSRPIGESNGVRPSPSPEKSGKRKRNQVIYSDEEEANSMSSAKSPAKKKTTLENKCEVGEAASKGANGVVDSLVNTAPSAKNSPALEIKIPIPTRKTAPRTLPFGSTLHPNIRKILEEQENRRKSNSFEDDSSSSEDSESSLENDSKNKSLSDQASTEKEPIDLNKSATDNISEDKKSPTTSGSKSKSSSKVTKKVTKKKTSPKSKLSMFKKQELDKTPTSKKSSTLNAESVKTESENKAVSEKMEQESDKESSLNKKENDDDNSNEESTPEGKEEHKSKEESPSKEKEDSKESPPKKKEIHAFFGVKKDKDGKTNPPPQDPGASYNPAKSKYHPIEDAFWKHGDKVPYLALARTLEEVEAVRARLKIVEILSNYLRSVLVLSPADLVPSVYLCLNKLAPAYHSLELGLADTTIYKMIAQTTGRSLAQVKADVAASGDVGLVAEQSRSTQRMMFKPSPLTVHGVFHKLKEIAHMSGQASMGKKVDKIQSMFVACRYSEARFLIRSLAGKLRIGLAEQSVLQAIAQACVMTPPCQEYPPEIINAASSMSADAFKTRLDEEALIIKTTYCECPNYDQILEVILREGVRALPQHCRLTPGIPLKPMLAHPTKGVSEVLQRFDGLRFTCEWKYDGERAQIHLSEGGEVSVYSRNQENNTSKYPDIVSRLSSCLEPGVTSCVLDTEAVAWDTVNKRIQPFQVLSTRKKKDCVESEIKVQVCVYMFDLLYLNGEALVQKTLAERRKLLRENFHEIEEQFVFATSLDTSTMEEVQDFLEESVKGNCEGLMVKTLESDATYEIAKRSRNWLKLKKDYLAGVGDTLDLVVIGGFLGKGKRTGVYGGFLLACYHPSSEEYQSVCKIGTGFSDEALQKHSETLRETVIPSPRPYYRYDPSHEPDHWFDATAVWEVKCADLSLSPVHRAAVGIVDPDKGISLRFPRFIRVREDKQSEEATSAEQIADMYNNQDQIKNQQGDSKVADEDFY